MADTTGPIFSEADRALTVRIDDGLQEQATTLGTILDANTERDGALVTALRRLADGSPQEQLDAGAAGIFILRSGERAADAPYEPASMLVGDAASAFLGSLRPT